MSWKLVACTILVIAICGTARAESYGMSELEALEKQSSWQELVEHADDIAPTQRNARWVALVEEAATEILAGIDADKVSFSGLGVADALTRRYPQLKRSKTFMHKRADVGLRAFVRCFELTGDDNVDADACATRLVGFSDGDPDNADLTHRSIVLIETHFHFTTASAFPLYARLIGSTRGAKECSEAGAKKATINALEGDRADPRVRRAQEVASRLCWDQMQNELVDALGKPHAGAHYFENSCHFLVDKRALGNLQTSRCNALPK